MKRSILVLAALLTLAAGGVTTANAVEFGVGPGGVYVGPDQYGDEYYDDEYYGDEDYGGCRTIVEHRTNRFGEVVEFHHIVCD